MLGIKKTLCKMGERVIWSWQEVERQREHIQGGVTALRIERRNWAALANGQKMVDSFDYQYCFPVLQQLSIFNSSTSTKASSSVIIGFLKKR